MCRQAGVAVARRCFGSRHRTPGSSLLLFPVTALGAKLSTMRLILTRGFPRRPGCCSLGVRPRLLLPGPTPAAPPRLPALAFADCTWKVLCRLPAGGRLSKRGAQAQRGHRETSRQRPWQRLLTLLPLQPHRGALCVHTCVRSAPTRTLGCLVAQIQRCKCSACGFKSLF